MTPPPHYLNQDKKAVTMGFVAIATDHKQVVILPFLVDWIRSSQLKLCVQNMLL